MNQAEDFNILLVEDNNIDAELFKRCLHKIEVNNHVSRVTDGQMALEFLLSLDEEEKEKPWVVLLDINMPKMNGIEFLKTVRDNGRLKHVPVFVLTSSDDCNEVERCYDNGVFGYIVKPSGMTSMADFFGPFIKTLSIMKLPLIK